MTVLENPRHERFAQALAKGMTADAAYEAAGFKKHDGNAARLRGNERIAARLAELQSKVAEKLVLNRADVLRELADNAVKAKGVAQFSASNQALQLYGKELGMFIDRRLVGFKNIEDMTEAELMQFLGAESGNGD